MKSFITFVLLIMALTISMPSYATHNNTTNQSNNAHKTINNTSVYNNYTATSIIAMAASQIDMSQHNKHFQLGIGGSYSNNNTAVVVSIGYGTGKALYKISIGQSADYTAVGIGGVWKF